MFSLQKKQVSNGIELPDMVTAPLKKAEPSEKAG